MPNTNYRQKQRKKLLGPLRYADYNRCSSDDQKYGDFTTIDNQKAKNAEYIRTTGCTHVGTYTDEGKTGTNVNRPDFKRLVKDAQNGQFDAVVVTYMSRLARGPAFYIAEYMLKEAGVQIVMVEEKFSDDLQGQINKEVTIFADGIQPKQASMHTRTKMESMVSRGYVAGQIPFGYRKEYITSESMVKQSQDKAPPQIALLDEDAAPLVQQAFSMAKNRCTRADIREYLIMVSGRKWTTTQVTYLLNNPAYIGIQQFGDWVNESGYPVIIERDLWDAVQAILAETPARPPRKPKGQVVNDPYLYYLRGRVHCPFCGENGKGCAYTQASAGGTHYYVCLLDNKQQAKCPVGRVNANALHYTVLSFIERAVRHHTVIHRMIAETEGWQTAPDELTTKLRQVIKQLQSIKLRKNNLLDSLASGKGTASILNFLEELEQQERLGSEQQKTLEREIQQATLKRPTAQQVQAVWGAMLEIWPDLTEEEKAELLSEIVQEVVVKSKDRVLLRLSSLAEVHGHFLAINSQMGAGVRLELTTFGL